MNFCREAQRESFYRVDETCPAVDEAAGLFKEAFERELDKFVDRVKDQTEALRKALTGAIEETLERDRKIVELEQEISELKDRLRDAESDT